MQLSESIPDEAPSTSRWASVLAHATEVPAALLVLAEIVILGGGAFTRYVLHQPITWTDELASILFVWLAMLGAVIALRRGEHMQLTTFVKDVSPAGREWLDALGMFLVMAFLLLLAGPGVRALSGRPRRRHADAGD
jgi:TRAP-type C4-dicarboxylate transport system permease small subunit